MDEQAAYERARKRVEEIRGFYTHLATYIVTNLFLFILNYVTSRGNWWFYWPLFGWGIGLVAHGVSVFGFGGIFGHGWEERKIREIMEREKERGQGP